ncbi:ABC transporter permease [Longirhabdus pacifica]|uniref:ABC transporter permease n=1 Tax=Longirhabdus pacifica TaxID=2305227 RepID=UPI001008EFC9|nr:ABC transporter permease [Longirhabdus pacifica]
MEILAQLGSITNQSLVFATALIFTAMGGIFSERSGVINIGLEGLMITGAFAAGVTAYYAEAAGLGGFSAYVALLAAFLFGVIFSLIHAVASITFKADQVVSGVVINLLALGGTVYAVKLIFDSAQTDTLNDAMLTKVSIPYLSDIPFIGTALFKAYPTTYIALIIVLITFYLLYRTPFGLRLRAAGEHPSSVDTVGVNVFTLRYLGVMISGGLAGLGGATLVLTTTSSFAANTVSGQGFIALAAMIFGKWHPVGALGAAFFFGIAQNMTNVVKLYEWSSGIPEEFMYMLPYVLTILVLAGLVGKAYPPKALGEPYDAGKR